MANKRAGMRIRMVVTVLRVLVAIPTSEIFPNPMIIIKDKKANSQYKAILEDICPRSNQFQAATSLKLA